MSFISSYVTCAGREIHYTEWGVQHKSVVVAWHGLARTGRDMDELAAHLSSRYRVICPDMIGRGLSQWSPSPDTEYTCPFTHVSPLRCLINCRLTGRIGWVRRWAVRLAWCARLVCLSPG